MGYMRHHAILVTSWDKTLLAKAHDTANGIFPQVSDITAPDGNNGYQSFFIPPDGSKEGWDASQEGDDSREAFIEWLRSKTYDDGSSSLDWAEVQYGDEAGEALIVSHNADRRRVPPAADPAGREEE